MSEPVPLDRFDERAADASSIGTRLRVQRERLGLSLREIARRVGVSASLISQIERDWEYLADRVAAESAISAQN